MTVGFPDWSRLQMQGGQELYAAQFNPAGDLFTPVLDALGFAYVQVNFNDLGNVAHKQLTIRFYNDNGGTSQINSKSWIVVPGSEDFKTIPCMGRFFNIEMHSLETPVGEVSDVIIYGSNALVPGFSTNQPSTPLIWFRGTIGAGATQNVFASGTHEGPATLSVVATSTTAWNASLQFWSPITLALNTFQYGTGAQFGNGWTQRVSLPPAPCVLSVQNTDTVGRFFALAVTLG